TAGMVRDIEPDTARMKSAAGQGYSTATDLADWLVRAAGMPFREAHHVTGRIVALASDRGIGLHRLSLEDMRSVDERITQDVFSVLSVTRSVQSRVSYGGTAPSRVRAQAKRWLKRLQAEAAKA
ncbi:MAG TPA: argininosuccinate lyase, partial [Xanthobacteraceae bacterium]|nr:argininosuccinate lyase [Xanthobacteraceae bacterium]